MAGAQPTAYASTSSSANSIVDITIQPGPNEFSRNFAWYSTSREAGRVQIARAIDVIDGAFPANRAINFRASLPGAATPLDGYLAHHVSVTGLAPNTEYVYRVGGRRHWSEMFWFRTGDTANGAFSFLFVGDPQLHNHNPSTEAWQNNLNRAVVRWPQADFIVSSGDQIDTAGSEAHFRRFFSPVVLRSVPVAPTLGNHDRAANFTLRFNMPNLDWANGVITNGTIAGNYYYTYGNVLFMHLNSNSLDTAQHRAFMQNAVDNNPGAGWRIVLMHHTPYGVAAYGSDTSRRRPFYPLMDEFGVDVVLNGHDHIYSRSHHMLGNVAQRSHAVNDRGQAVNPRGTVYITGNSASGSKFYASTGRFPAHNAFQHQSNTPNISRVDMTHDSFTISTYRSANRAADGDFILIETYSILKINP